MPEPIPFPCRDQVAAPPSPPPSAAPPPPAPTPRPAAPLWPRLVLLLGIVAVVLRLLLFLLTRPSVHPTLPTAPFHAGDVFTLTPGDANITKWAQSPLATGFIVQQLSPNGQPAPSTPPVAPAPTFCALQPNYMADAQQPGGTLTLLSHQPTGDWQVRWSGGNTLPPFIKQKGDFDANCGTNALLLLHDDQLHSLHDILAGTATASPPGTAAP